MDFLERIARRVNRKFYRVEEQEDVVRPHKYQEIIDAEMVAVRRQIAAKAIELRQKKAQYKKKRA